MVARKRPKKPEPSASETIIEAQIGTSWMAGIANRLGAHLPLWLVGSLFVSILALALAGWPYLDRMISPQPASPWASDMAQIQAETASKIAELEARISALEENAVTLEGRVQDQQAGQIKLADEMADITSILAELDQTLEALAERPSPQTLPQVTENPQMGAHQTAEPKADDPNIDSPSNRIAGTPDNQAAAGKEQTSFGISSITGFFSAVANNIWNGASNLGGLFSSVITISPVPSETEATR